MPHLDGRLSFIESAFTTKASYEAWIQGERAATGAATTVSWEPDIAQELLRMCEGWQHARPILVAIAGVGGAGKTTSAQILSGLVADSCVLPMDGYHYPLSALRAMDEPEDKVYRRGAPDTFDIEGLRRDLTVIRGGADTVELPGFDHAVGDPALGMYSFVRAQHRVVILEGLWLLHEDQGWAGIPDLFDVRVFIDADIDTSLERLRVRNRCIPGYTPEQIDIRVDEVDRINAQLIVPDVGRAHHPVRGVTSVSVRPVVFLDIDGVLNRTPKNHHIRMDDELVEKLCGLVVTRVGFGTHAAKSLET